MLTHLSAIPLFLFLLFCPHAALHQTTEHVPEPLQQCRPGDPLPSADEVEDAFEDFYEDVLVELGKQGKVDYLHVCDNLAAHLCGNVYACFREEEAASGALAALNGRYYLGRPIVAELSPVTSFSEACCRFVSFSPFPISLAILPFTLPERQWADALISPSLPRLASPYTLSTSGSSWRPVGAAGAPCATSCTSRWSASAFTASFTAGKDRHCTRAGVVAGATKGQEEQE